MGVHEVTVKRWGTAGNWQARLIEQAAKVKELYPHARSVRTTIDGQHGIMVLADAVRFLKQQKLQGGEMQ